MCQEWFIWIFAHLYLTVRWKFLFEKQTNSHSVQKSPSFHGLWKLVTLFTRVQHWFLYSAIWIHTTTSSIFLEDPFKCYPLVCFLIFENRSHFKFLKTRDCHIYFIKCFKIGWGTIPCVHCINLVLHWIADQDGFCCNGEFCWHHEKISVSGVTFDMTYSADTTRKICKITQPACLHDWNIPCRCFHELFLYDKALKGRSPSNNTVYTKWSRLTLLTSRWSFSWTQTKDASNYVFRFKVRDAGC